MPGGLLIHRLVDWRFKFDKSAKPFDKIDMNSHVFPEIKRSLLFDDQFDRKCLAQQCGHFLRSIGSNNIIVADLALVFLWSRVSNKVGRKAIHFPQLELASRHLKVGVFLDDRPLLFNSQRRSRAMSVQDILAPDFYFQIFHKSWRSSDSNRQEN